MRNSYANHYWDYYQTANGKTRRAVLEVCVYSSLQSMRRGIIRHAMKNRHLRENIQEYNSRESLKDTHGLCRCWVERDRDTGLAIPVSRIFITRNSPARIIAHECFHAGLHTERTLFSKNPFPDKRLSITNNPDDFSAFNEERAVCNAELFFSDITGWIKYGFKDKV